MTSKKFLLILSVILFAAFVFFSYLVSKEKFVQFDFNATVRFQDHISRRFDMPFTFFSILGTAEVTGLIWLAILVFLIIKRYFWAVLSMFLFWGVLVLEIFGKLFVYHPGPPFLFYRGTLDFSFPSSYAHTSYSYPSGHMTRASFLVAFIVIWFYLKVPFAKRLPFQLGILFLWVLMFISRIYLGEHWATDVIGGSLLGASAGIFTSLHIPLKKRRDLNFKNNLGKLGGIVTQKMRIF